MIPLIIRADSNSKIGTGHIMRCIALAQAWQDRGGQVIFVSHCESQMLHKRILNEGFDLIPIGKPHPDPSDLQQTIEVVSRYASSSTLQSPSSNLPSPCSSFHTPSSELSAPSSGLPAPCSLLPAAIPWICLDGYHFTPDYQKSIRNAGGYLLVIDDMNHLSKYHANILLNQNIHAPDLNYNCDKDTTLLLGTRYVLLRKEFLKYQDFKRQIPNRAKNILVTLGGADPDNVTLKVIEAIKLLNDSNLEVKVVVGPENLNLISLKNSMLHAPCPIYCIENAKDMPELMVWADMAISGGGSTCWELAFMRLPALCLVLADNQRETTRYLEEGGYIFCLLEAKQLNPNMISENLNSLIINYKLRNNLSRRGNNLVPGNGPFLISSLVG